MCVPNLSYKSILPGTNRTTKQYINSPPTKQYGPTGPKEYFND
jgi:hypothetical protein